MVDPTIQARMEKFDASNEEAAAGLLIRENQPSTRARGAFLGVAREGLMFRRCENYWQEPQQWDEKAMLPCWFKLSRYGKDVRAYRSDDGIHATCPPGTPNTPPKTDIRELGSSRCKTVAAPPR